ncbi:MAG TPA: hypothetical protein VNZ86_18270, partial [Bacteroidia bacterium]|nr:hypothetical protein [Bacteroidia bacterium]
RLIILDELNALSSGLSQELKRFVQSGGSLLVFPGDHADLPSYRDFLLSVNAATYTQEDTANTRVDNLNTEHEIYRQGVFEHKQGKDQSNHVQMDLPLVFTHYKMSRNSHSSEEDLMKLRGGDLFLAKYLYEKGSVYLCSSPLNTDAGNFSRHALFVPTLLQIAFFSQARNRLFYTIGENEVITLNSTPASGEDVFHISSPDTKFDIIPEHRIVDSKTEIFVRNQVREAGNYNLLANKEQIDGLSFNYNRRESDVSTLDPAGLKEALAKAGLNNFSLIETGQKDLKSLLSEIDQGKKLWKWCILLALLFLAVEIALLRLLK